MRLLTLTLLAIILASTSAFAQSPTPTPLGNFATDILNGTAKQVRVLLYSSSKNKTSLRGVLPKGRNFIVGVSCTVEGEEPAKWTGKGITATIVGAPTAGGSLDDKAVDAMAYGILFSPTEAASAVSFNPSYPYYIRSLTAGDTSLSVTFNSQLGRPALSVVPDYSSCRATIVNYN
jgi:hypothetical protein